MFLFLGKYKVFELLFFLRFNESFNIVIKTNFSDKIHIRNIKRYWKILNEIVLNIYIETFVKIRIFDLNFSIFVNQREFKETKTKISVI